LGSDEQMGLRSVVGLSKICRLCLIFGGVWSLACVTGSELVFLEVWGVWGVSCMQLSNSSLAAGWVVDSFVNSSMLVVKFLKTVLVAYFS